MTIYPGQADEMIRNIRMLGNSLEEVNEEQAEEMGLVAETWWVQRQVGATKLIFMIEAPDPPKSMELFHRSDAPIAIWLRNQLKNRTTYNPVDLREIDFDEGDREGLEVLVTWSRRLD
ncbi:MAG: hypothetical protein M3280_07720 [Actinomycetota bacterium]|nr:hypothetical protein [Actinomycetota bacterium]